MKILSVKIAYHKIPIRLLEGSCYWRHQCPQLTKFEINKIEKITTLKNDPNEKITQIDENYPNLTQIQKWPKYKNNPKSKMTQNLKKKN